MAKTKSVFYCQSCGNESPKWLGKCPSCGEWNTYIEQKVTKTTTHDYNYLEKILPVNINEAPVSETSSRFSSEVSEFDRVLGGGIVLGSLVLIGGEPGIGKSTLLLQVALSLKNKVLYVSGEESVQQIKLRAARIKLKAESCFLLAETNLSNVIQQAESMLPDLVIIDSVQTLHSAHIESAIGSVSQVKECTGQLMKFAKQKNIPIILIGHVNKDGAIAGPKVLEHMVDTVLQFEGDRHMTYRILRTIKNRFGSTSELGIFEMQGGGLRQITNPSEILISAKGQHLSGVALGATMEGNRPFIIETQALVSPSSYGQPQRSTTGYDHKRLNMLLAVMEKRVGLRLSAQDVFLNIAGGLKIQDTALDLSLCVSLYSSFEDIAVPEDIVFAAEVGLGGELRTLANIDNRINEAERLGFSKIYIAKNLRQPSIKSRKIEIKPYDKLTALLRDLF